MSSLPAKMKALFTLAKTLEKQKLNFSRSALFHMKTRVSLKYLVNDCRYLNMMPKTYDVICNRFRYLIRQKSGITYAISHNYARIKIGSSDYLTIEYTLLLHNVIILIKSVFDKDQNHCYYYIFLEKCS